MKVNVIDKRISKGRNVFVAILFIAVLSILPLRPAFACPFCTCSPPAHGTYQAPPGDYNTRLPGNSTTIRGVIIQEHNPTADHILTEFDDLEAFLLAEVWEQHLLPAWMMMTEQITVASMMQMFMLGTLFDAKQNLEVQNTMQELVAEAHKDYHSDHGMCVIGTTVRSLASAQRNAEYTTFVMSQRSMDRQMGNMRHSSARDNGDNICYRMRQFRERYCDTESNNRQMGLICDPTGTVYEQCRPDNINITDATRNMDVSFSQVIDRSATLDVDFYDGQATASEDEIDIFALANNLYSNNVMYRIPENTLRYRDNQDELLDMRSVIAKRNVAEHSFNAIVGLKSKGTIDSDTFTTPYLTKVWEALDVTAAPDIQQFLGERPSYYAQMEVMTKRLYQQPEFFTNLYDEPVNVERKGVALQAIALMQNFDTWDSHLRTEAMLSVLLELELMTLQEEIDNIKGSVRSTGVKLN